MMIEQALAYRSYILHRVFDPPKFSIYMTAFSGIILFVHTYLTCAHYIDEHSTHTIVRCYSPL